ncbi:MAG: D-ribose ABC transporter substrate-binding protein, partial [Anaerolineaceae bacterium]
MKRLAIVLNILLIAMMLLTACAPKATETPAATTGEGEVTLGLVISTLNNPFFVTLRDGAQAAADAAGAKLIVVDAQDDSA